MTGRGELTVTEYRLAVTGEETLPLSKGLGNENDSAPGLLQPD